MEAPGQRRVDATTGWAMRETERESLINVLFWKEMIHERQYQRAQLGQGGEVVPQMEAGTLLASA